MKIVELSQVYTASDNGFLYYGANLTKRVSRRKPKTMAEVCQIIGEFFPSVGSPEVKEFPAEGVSCVQMIDENGRGYRAIIKM
jgi:hypothetical protein